MTTKNALFVGWNRSVAGREAVATEVFQSFINLCTKYQTQGLIESFEPVILESHGGDLNGYCLIRGDKDKLLKMRDNDDWKNLWMEGLWCMQGLGYTEAYVGAGVQDRMTTFKNIVQKHAKT